MKDGLYRVETKHFVAGFVIKQGKVSNCAPILKRRFEYYKTIAVHLGDNMQQNGKVISIELDISIPKQDGSGSYKGSRLIYTDDGGKIQTQAFHENSFKFNAALKQQLKELKPGDAILIDKEKPEGSSFWKVNGILKQDASVSPASDYNVGKAPAQASPKSTYETPEERAKKQVYIVRQSSISNALELVSNNPEFYKKSKDQVKDVLEIAKQFEDYVFDNKPAPVSDNFPDDKHEVF